MTSLHVEARDHDVAALRRRVCLVRAARRAASRRTPGPLVRTAFRAAALRADADRRRAAAVAWRESACLDAACRPSRFSALLIARERRDDGRLPCRDARLAYFALRLVFGLAVAGGGGKCTPARRAFDRPIAMACFVDRAPCLPSRTWCISSRTNGPACVVGARPVRLAFRDCRIVAFSGIATSRMLC